VKRVASEDGGVSDVAFEDFYRSQWAPMVRLAWLLSGSRHDGEDVVHDAFLRVEQRFREITEPVAYLRSAVVNGVRMLQRHREVERRHLPEPELRADSSEPDDLLAALRALPSKERHALVLRYYLGLSVNEVATQLTCPLGTAKSLLHRGIERLRGRLSS
jgi:RNA polymerase sigma factor (sigma-70 family)